MCFRIDIWMLKNYGEKKNFGGANWTLALSSTSFTRPRLEKALLNGLFS
jgi:hypothetical protein